VGDSEAVVLGGEAEAVGVAVVEHFGFDCVSWAEAIGDCCLNTYEIEVDETLVLDRGSPGICLGACQDVFLTEARIAWIYLICLCMRKEENPRPQGSPG